MQRRTTTTTLLRQINRSAVIDLIRREGVVSPSSIAARLRISLPTVMRVIDDLIAEEVAEYDGFDDAVRGRPPARVKFRGDGHAIIGIEATRREFYGAVSDLNGNIQTEARVPADGDGARNVKRLIELIRDLERAPRPHGQSIRGIGVGVPSIVRQPDGLVVLTLGLGWENLPLRKILSDEFREPVFVENGRNLAAVGEWGFGAGQGAGSVISLAIGPGAGAGLVIDGKLFRGRSQAAGELAWYLDDPELNGRTFRHLGDKQSLRFGSGIPEHVIAALEAASKRYVRGTLSLADIFAPGSTQQLQAVDELIAYVVMATASLTALLNPDVVVLAGQIDRGGPLIVDAVTDRLKGRVYDPPRLVVSSLGHRDVVMGAIMTVLDATTLNPGA